MAKLAAGFGSTRRANCRLLQLTRAGLLRRFFVGRIAHGRKAVYTLSPKGAGLVAAKLGGIQRPSGRLIVGDAFVEHLRRWLGFRQSISKAIKLTPDGYFEIESGQAIRAMFLEVDLGTEALAIWRQKTALQLALPGEFATRLRQPQFRVLAITSSGDGLSNIRAVVTNPWYTGAASENRKRNAEMMATDFTNAYGAR